MSEYKILNESCTSRDQILEHFLVESGTQHVKFQKLNEEVKNTISNKMIQSIAKSIKSKYSEVDVKIIENTRGNINNLKGYEDLVNSVNFLVSLNARNNKSVSEIMKIHTALEMITKYRSSFEKGFTIGDDVVKLLYNTMVIAIIKSTSFLIATSLEYVKDPMGIYSVAIKESIQKNKELDIYLDSISKFVSYYNKGQLDSFFKSALNTNEKISITEASYVGPGGVIGNVFLGTISVVVIILLIRHIIYMYYHSKVVISDNLRQMAIFIELNSSTMSNDMKATKEKQEKLVKMLYSLSNSIGIDHKVSSKKAITDLKEDDKKIKDEEDLDGKFL